MDHTDHPPPCQGTGGLSCVLIYRVEARSLLLSYGSAPTSFSIQRVAWSILKCARRTRLLILYTFLQRCGQGCPLLRASSDHRSSIFSFEGGLDGLPLRVSNEVLLILHASL